MNKYLAYHAVLGPAMTTPPPSWKSGAGMDSSLTGGVNRVVNGDFAAWRGTPTLISTVWADASYGQATGLNFLDAGGTYGTWTGDLDLTCGGIWASDGDSWADAASGAWNSSHRMWQRWSAILTNAQTKWTRIARGTLYLRLAHELNGNWYDWEVTPAQVADFKTAWQRFYSLKQSLFPDAQLVFNTTGATRGQAYDWRTIWPGDSYVDVYSVDWYADNYYQVNILGHSGSDGYGGPVGLNEHFAFAVSHNKPFAISEWGVDPIYGRGDDPQYIQFVHDFCVANGGTGAAKLNYESYFNFTKSASDRRQLYYAPGYADAIGQTATEFPQAAAQYISAF
ncbi:hypothetical protein EYC59_05915 [Candidatus Saccharibacteria bacterium]|nr:MAG: hypothetical protein EYC59_05915 [Candidatus Saccharibacteria bacterium]